MKTGFANAITRRAPTASLLLAVALLAAPTAARADILYAPFPDGRTIEKFDPATGADLGTFATITSAQTEPAGLALDAAGNLYAAIYHANTIMKFTPDGRGSVFATTGLGMPVGLAVDKAGNVYAGVGYYDYPTLSMVTWIEKFTPDGVGSLFADTGTGFRTGLAFDSAGNLYASGYLANTILKFTPDGVGSLFASTDLNIPRGLAFDTAGNLYVANEGEHTIRKFTPAGVGSVFAARPDDRSLLNSPGGLAFDSAGNLYAGDYYTYGGLIDKFTPDGTASVFAYTPLRPGWIAIQQVPEPSAWALLSFGLASPLAFYRPEK